MRRLLFHTSVAGQKIPVVLDTELTDVYGEFHADKLEIRVSVATAANNKLLQETLRHEVFHACMFLSGLSFAVTSELEEQIVRMADGILWGSVNTAAKAAREFRKEARRLRK